MARVLVVDDMPETRRLMRRVLERARFTVSEAATGEAGLATIRRDAPDAVVLDLRLPGISGFDVARRPGRPEPSDRRDPDPRLLRVGPERGPARGPRRGVRRVRGQAVRRADLPRPDPGIDCAAAPPL